MKKYADIVVAITVEFEDDGELDLPTQAIEAATELLNVGDYPKWFAGMEVLGPVRDTEMPA